MILIYLTEFYFFCCVVTPNCSQGSVVVGVGVPLCHHKTDQPSSALFTQHQLLFSSPAICQKYLPANSSPSSSPSQSQYSLLQFSPNNIPAGQGGLLKLLSAKNIKSGYGSGQCSLLSVQPPEIWGQPDRIIIFIRLVFVDSSHPAIHNYQVFLFNKEKVHWMLK